VLTAELLSCFRVPVADGSAEPTTVDRLLIYHPYIV
jgi:hypothetical protein